MHKKPDWIPDWRDKALYPDTTTPKQWAWEFLRRNPGYWEDWKRLMSVPEYQWMEEVDTSKEAWFLSKPQDPSNPPMDWYECSPPAKKGELKDQWLERVGNGRMHHLCPFIAQKYGLSSRILPPCENDTSKYFDFAFASSISKGAKLISEELSENKHAIIFDLSLPIDPQLKRAKAHLEKIRPLSETKLRKHSRFGNYNYYLRILDARLSGVSYSEIAKELFPREENSHSNGFPASDKVKKSFQAAKRLRDGGYIQIVL